VHEEALKEVVDELQAVLPGRFLGRVFQTSSFSVAIDFGLREHRYLFISIEPAAPRLYLIKRKSRELEKSSLQPSLFVQAVRTVLGGCCLLSLRKDENERVIRLSFEVADDSGGEPQVHTLIAQLTGRSANLFLLGPKGSIKHAWRKPHGEGQQPGDSYNPPKLPARSAASSVTRFERQLRQTAPGVRSISEALDKYYRERDAENEFDSLAADLRSRLAKEISRRKKLETNLRNDLRDHGNPEEHKRVGDLLLANITTAKRRGTRVSLQDYFSEGIPTVELEVDENVTLQEAAGDYFSRYAKAKRAIEETGARLAQVDRELKEISEKRRKLEAAIASRDAEQLGEFEDKKRAPLPTGKKVKAPLSLPGVRRYRSSDGYEVLVGKTSRDNDRLTFRVARPNDLWLHAGDYPGSHVIVRNSGRKEIPHRTIIEAAQLAGKFSQAGEDSKVNIHYTQRKFVTKPKGAAPGLVRMSVFKSINVVPGENLERIK
jgi:predicted ribosome quality control (RQC) complex YloA/Tae2 family protein